MSSSRKLRRSRIQTTFDPYELPLFSDSSQNESNDESGNDPIQHDSKRCKVILGPQLPVERLSESEDRVSQKRGAKRKRTSEQIRPLSDYLSLEKANPDSPLYEVASNRRENHASGSQPNSDEECPSNDRRIPTFWDPQAGQCLTSCA